MPPDTTEALLAELDEIQSAEALEPAALERARSLIGHADNDVRWQALIAVAGWIPEAPDVVWQVVLEHGVSEDDDMRSGVATVVLEHLLEHHFDAYFPLLRERIEAGASLLADTLGSCWPFGQAVPHWDEVQALARRHRPKA